jgi:hypothetical protein
MTVEMRKEIGRTRKPILARSIVCCISTVNQQSVGSSLHYVSAAFERVEIGESVLPGLHHPNRLLLLPLTEVEKGKALDRGRLEASTCLTCHPFQHPEAE